MIEAATAEVKSLGNCCKDSDNVLDKINALHEKLSGQGTARSLRARHGPVVQPTMSRCHALRALPTDGDFMNAAKSWCLC